mmetsp:Transcript_6868/g.28974  ORF Transcript_6868/g.28974 Transcript_6868/m.28974 type:complete len:416 (+) Transcript_6868:3869-5116(+)
MRQDRLLRHRARRRRAIPRLGGQVRRGRPRRRGGAAHRRAGGGRQAAGGGPGDHLHARAVGHGLAPLETAQERAQRGPLHHRRAAPRARQRRPRHGGGRLAHALHCLGDGQCHPRARAGHVHRQLAQRRPVAGRQLEERLQLPAPRTARAAGAAPARLRRLALRLPHAGHEQAGAAGHRATRAAEARHCLCALARRALPLRRRPARALPGVGGPAALPAHPRRGVGATHCAAGAQPLRDADAAVRRRHLPRAPVAAGEGRDREGVRGRRRAGAARNAHHVLGHAAAGVPRRRHRRGVLRRQGAPLHRLCGGRRAADGGQGRAARGRRQRQVRLSLPRAQEGVLQEVSLRAAAGRVTPRPRAGGPHECRDLRQDRAGQAGRRRLPHLDAALPAPHAKPELLQPAWRHPPPRLGPPL